MCRGLGKIELAVATAFIKNPTGAFTLNDIVRFAYPRAIKIEKKHKVSAIRAADSVAIGTGWRGFRTSANPPLVCFANLLSARSVSRCLLRLGLPEESQSAALVGHLEAGREAREQMLDRTAHLREQLKS